MASISRRLEIAVSPADAWDAVRDFGALHTRLARGFVAECTLDGDDRVITFVTGMTVRERLVSADDERRRLAYTIVDGPYTHHHGVAQIDDAGDGSCMFVWTNDLLPDELAAPTAAAMELGLAAFKATLEAS